jgi:F0F1-type ATP synthase membrane subunit a
MSGHIIFKVFLGGAVEFAFSTKSLSIVYTLLTAASLCFLVVLVILEIAISVIQVYVFVVIFCMFLSDSFGHHFRH